MKKILLIIFLILLIAGGIIGWTFYNRIYTSNVISEDQYEFFIPSDFTYDSLSVKLKEEKIVKNFSSFNWVANQMNLPNTLKPGRYLLTNGLNNREFVALLRSGRQSPVKVVFNKERTLADLCGTIGSQIEADSIELYNHLTNNTFLSKHQLDSNSIMTKFIPNTYEFFWNTSAEKWANRMFKEQSKFWTKDRNKKAEELSLNHNEIITLASIVEEETNKYDEMPKVAGVYLNRLKKGWKLQADPTVKFALQDFEIRRVLNKHLEFASPYNTYYTEGLPPGPICTPSVKTIDAVLNAEEHDYMYFCAKDDFSGYHAFAKTLKQHNLNAKNYQKALNQRKIFN